MFGAADTERDRTALPLGSVAIYLVGVAALAFCITLLWFGMRAVMDLGGFCASGGPYVIAVECPDAVLATTPLSILGGFLAAGLVVWGGAALGGSWMSLVFLAWPALFLSLGWNFLEYGFSPPGGGWVWSWLFCGVLFVLMGGVPLVLAIGALRAEGGDGRSYASGRVVVRPKPTPPSADDTRSADPPEDATASVRGPNRRRTTPTEPLVDRLERLAAMRRRGDLTSDGVRECEGGHPGRGGWAAMSRGFQPVWLRFAVIVAAIVGIVVAYWLFGALAGSG